MFGAFPQWGVSSVGLAQHLVTSSMESLGGRSLGEHISFYLSKDEGPCRKAGGRRKDLLDSDRRTLQPPRGAAWEPGLECDQSQCRDAAWRSQKFDYTFVSTQLKLADPIEHLLTRPPRITSTWLTAQ